MWQTAKYRTGAIAVLAATAAACLFAVTLPSPDLSVRLDGDTLKINLPNTDFLAGKPMARLKNGGSVAFIGQLSVSTVNPAAQKTPVRALARFAFSYDIWEEKISVTRIGPTPGSNRTVSHLTPAAARAWCLDNLTLDKSSLPASDFWVQLDLRAEDPRDQSGIIGEPGINITRLIELFSRPAANSQPRWFFTNGPFRLMDFKPEPASAAPTESKVPRG